MASSCRPLTHTRTAPESPFLRLAPALPVTLRSGPSTRRALPCLGSPALATGPWALPSPLPAAPPSSTAPRSPLPAATNKTFTGAPRARRASSANTIGNDTKTNFTSAGENIPALSLAAIAASGAPTRSTNTTSNATAARLALTPKKWSSSCGSESTGPAASARLFILRASATLSTSRATSSLASVKTTGCTRVSFTASCINRSFTLPGIRWCLKSTPRAVEDGRSSAGTQVRLAAPRVSLRRKAPDSFKTCSSSFLATKLKPNGLSRSPTISQMWS